MDETLDHFTKLLQRYIVINSDHLDRLTDRETESQTDRQVKETVIMIRGVVQCSFCFTQLFLQSIINVVEQYNKILMVFRLYAPFTTVYFLKQPGCDI